jgi:DNA-binding beta-propeller fold protein YncE
MTIETLQQIGYVALPKHDGAGGFDHAAVNAASGQVYVAHTANNTVDVFDPTSAEYLFSIPGLSGVAGVIASDQAQLIITSNRSENTLGIFAPGPNPKVRKVPVGVRPNGLAYDHSRRLVLVANVGDPAVPSSHTLSMVNLDDGGVQNEIGVPGRTRWAVYDRDAQVFYVNIADPAQIIVVDAQHPVGIARTFPIPSAGPHGLDLDLATRRLFCACDEGTLVTLDRRRER